MLFFNYNENTTDKMKGELYEIDSVTLDKLNGLGDEGFLYRLRQAPVLIGKDNQVIANVYEYLHDVEIDNYVLMITSRGWRGIRTVAKYEII